MLSKGITIRAHKPTNSIFIRHYAADLERIKKLIREKLDIPLPQVKIEARMEILDRDDLFAIGVQWGGGGVRRTRTAAIVGRGFTSDRQQSPAVPGGPTGVLRNLEPSGSDPAADQRHDRTAHGRQPRQPPDRCRSRRRPQRGRRRHRVRYRRKPEINLNLALEALRVLSKTRTLAPRDRHRGEQQSDDLAR